jgi:dipeptidyl aminopeptidase/acylaminoacyl peptidase
VPLSGGAAIRLTASKKEETKPRFSPDGKWLAFLSEREGKKAQVWLMNRAGGEAVKLTRFKAGVSDLAWSPDSTRLVLVAQDPDPDDPEAEEEEEETEKEEAAAAAKPKPPKPVVIRRRQFKRDGEGYLGEFRQHLHLFELAARTSQQITSGAYDDQEPAWSPDGRLIAFTSNRTADPDSNQNADIFVVEAKPAQTPRPLTPAPAATSPRRSPPTGRWWPTLPAAIPRTCGTGPAISRWCQSSADPSGRSPWGSTATCSNRASPATAGRSTSGWKRAGTSRSPRCR